MPTIATSVVSLKRPMNVLTIPGNDDRQRLRQHDLPHHLRIAQAERLRRFELAARDGVQSAAHHFRHVGGCKQRHADQRPRQSVRRELLRHKERQHGVRHEQDRDQRHAAHELDEADGRGAHGRQSRAAPQREQHAAGQREHHANERHEQADENTAPKVGRDLRQAERGDAIEQNVSEDRKRDEEQQRAEPFARRGRDQKPGDQHARRLPA